ncbi:DUF748 domain-containing protein [Thiorhodococcus minor]|uniref:DUF748 domain-containing protein n=1 Tax=Thiorhodococcus minor TaxID=57489 RepID=UPI003158857B
MQLGRADTDGAQVGELELVLRVGPLFQRKASIQRLSISGIEIRVARAPDGAIRFNGVPYADLLTPTEPTAQRTERPDSASGVWQAGIDVFEVRDSRLVFENSNGGELEAEIEGLTMTDFRGWEPENPGKFDLKALVNGIRLNWSGEATPFADRVSVSIDALTEQADVPKLARFFGPTGLKRHGGTYSARLSYQGALADSGEWELQVQGTVEIDGVDYAREGVFSFATEAARIELDLDLASTQPGDLAIRGSVNADLGATSGSMADRTELATIARLAARDIDLTRARDGALRIAGRPEIDLEALSFSGPIDLSLDLLLELLVELQSLSTTQALSIADTGLGDLGGKAIRLPASDLSVGRIRLDSDAFVLQSQDGKAGLEATLRLELDAIEVATERGGARVEQWRGGVERFSVTTGNRVLHLVTNGDGALESGSLKGPDGAMSVRTLGVQVNGLELEISPGGLSLQLAASGEGSGYRAIADAAKARPELAIELGSVRTALTQASVTIADGALSWQAAGDAAAAAIIGQFSGGEAGSLEVARAEIDAAQARSPLQLGAETLTLGGLDLFVTRSLLMALMQGGSEAGDAGVTAPVADLAAPGAIPVEPKGARPPASGDSPEPTLDVRRIQGILAELGYDPGPIDGLMGRRTAAAVRQFQTAEGLSVDGRLSADLVSALERRATPLAQVESGVESGAKPDRRPEPSLQTTAGPQAPAQWHLGRLSLTSDAAIRFRDDLVSPNVVIDTRFSRFEAQGLDSRAPGQRALLDVAAEINERSQLALSGWIAGLPLPTDLDLKAEAANLQLTTYSPYATAVAGVHLNGGQLDAATEIKAAAGNLQGELRLDIDQIALQPADQSDAQGAGATGGVPLQTAVDLLADTDGRIALTLPVTGTVASPDIDIGPAVNKAIGGVLQAVFPPSLVASIMIDLTEGGAPTLDAIAFAPGSALMTAADRRVADDIARLAKQHPRLSLKVCGRATAKDVAAIAAQHQALSGKAVGRQTSPAQADSAPIPIAAADQRALQALAVARARSLTRYLIERGGIDADRISECRSTVDPNDQGNPRAEVLF